MAAVAVRWGDGNAVRPRPAAQRVFTPDVELQVTLGPRRHRRANARGLPRPCAEARRQSYGHAGKILRREVSGKPVKNGSP